MRVTKMSARKNGTAHPSPVPSKGRGDGQAWNFFWHTSCDGYGVARKFHNQSFALLKSSTMPMSLRMASMQLASIGVPPRVQRVHQPRRRLQVQGVIEVPQPVKIRHASQNVGTVSAELPAQPVQCVP